jgi:hypothetical protein
MLRLCSDGVRLDLDSVRSKSLCPATTHSLVNIAFFGGHNRDIKRHPEERKLDKSVKEN